MDSRGLIPANTGKYKWLTFSDSVDKTARLVTVASVVSAVSIAQN